jgi:hypothetical protein
MPGGESVPSLVSRGGTADVPGPVMPREAGVASHPATPSTTTKASARTTVKASARTTVPPVSCVDCSALPLVPVPDGLPAVAQHGRPPVPAVAPRVQAAVELHGRRRVPAALRAQAVAVQRGQRPVRAVVQRAAPVAVAKVGSPPVVARHGPAPAGLVRHASLVVAAEPRAPAWSLAAAYALLAADAGS